MRYIKNISGLGRLTRVIRIAADIQMIMIATDVHV